MGLNLTDMVRCPAWLHYETGEICHSKYPPFDLGWMLSMKNAITYGNSSYWAEFYGESKFRELVD